MEGNHKQQPYLLFMLFLSLFALLLWAVEAVVNLDPQTQQIVEIIDTAICVLFFSDFLHSLYIAKSRWRYLRTWGLLDLISSVPVIEPLRLARAARVIRILRVLRGMRAARILTVFIFEKRAQSALLTSLLLILLLVGFSSIAILHFEGGETGSNITTPEDAIWWSTATLTTVGYSDRYPVSAEGRAIAAFMMLSGVGLLAVFSGLFASWFLAPSQHHRDQELAQIIEELAALRAELARKQAEPDESPGRAALDRQVTS